MNHQIVDGLQEKKMLLIVLQTIKGVLHYVMHRTICGFMNTKNFFANM